MDEAMQAAALWGVATNEAYPIEDRLKAALQALEYFGNQED